MGFPDGCRRGALTRRPSDLPQSELLLVNVLQQIQQLAVEHGLRFILIGGLAVIEHGYGRLTLDIDLLVLREERQRWRELLHGLGYELSSEQDTFHQYRRTEKEKWPLDLMLANRETFAGLIAAASPVTTQGARVLLVSLDHLIALKLHVLKQARLHRFLKDFQDVVELVRINHLDLHSDAMRALFLKYGTTDLYEKIKRAVER